MQGLPTTLDTLGSGTVRVKEYIASTVEDAILASVRAERDGAIAIICAPIVAETIIKISRIPVHPIIPMQSVTNMLEDIKTRYRSRRWFCRQEEHRFQPFSGGSCRFSHIMERFLA